MVKKITRSSVKVIYTLEDYSGSIDGVNWLEADTVSTYTIKNACTVNMYLLL